MRYRSLGESGLLVSVAGLGCNNFGRRLDVAATRAVVDAAIDAGITLFDTADMYGGGGRSEEILGEVLAGRRDQIVLATKFGHQGVDMGYGPAAGAKGGRGYIRRAVEHSLGRLRTDYIDLYQIHTPDPVTPIERDPGGAGRARHRGQGPLHRALQLLRLAARRGSRHGAGAGNGPVHLGPESLVAARARRRGGSGARRPAFRSRRAAILPARQRAADRQDPARPGRADGTRLAGRAEYVTEAEAQTRSRRWPSGRDQHEVTVLEVAIGGACRAARLRIGDRRRDIIRAGQGERGGRRLGSVRWRARRHRRDRAPPASSG